MESRSERLVSIREIIEEQTIHSQEQILEKLRDLGFNVTQATLSRDLKYLKVGKIPDGDGGYKYVLPDRISKLENILGKDVLTMDGFLSMEFSGNIGVIKTIPAFSHSIASAIDAVNLYQIIGTIAGNDTIIVVLREGIKHEDLLKTLRSKFSELEKRI